MKLVLSKKGIDKNFSEIPFSILEITERSDNLRNIVNDEFYPDQDEIRSKRTAANPFKGHYSTVGRGDRYSEFNPDLAKFLIDYFSEKDDLVLDAMCGRGTRLMLARSLGRYSIGFDVCKPFVDSVLKNIESSKTLDETGIKYKPIVHLHDARYMEDKIPENYADMVFVCPPYWDIEEYPEEGVGIQLSRCHDYDHFLKLLDKIIGQCHKAIKGSSGDDYHFCVWVMADFVRDGKFYPFHSDVHNLFVKNGFELWTMAILKIIGGQMLSRVWQCKQVRRFAKMHEYILVYIKKSGTLNVEDKSVSEISKTLDWLEEEK